MRRRVDRRLQHDIGVPIRIRNDRLRGHQRLPWAGRLDSEGAGHDVESNLTIGDASTAGPQNLDRRRRGIAGANGVGATCCACRSNREGPENWRRAHRHSRGRGLSCGILHRHRNGGWRGDVIGKQHDGRCIHCLRHRQDRCIAAKGLIGRGAAAHSQCGRRVRIDRCRGRKDEQRSHHGRRRRKGVIRRPAAAPTTGKDQNPGHGGQRKKDSHQKCFHEVWRHVESLMMMS